MKNKYLIYTKQSKHFPPFSLFKVLNINGPKYTIVGKSKKLSTNLVSVYNIDMNDFSQDSWVDLESFINNCTIIGKKFYRSEPVIRKSATKDEYKDLCYTNKMQDNVIVAIDKDMWLCYDYSIKKLYFLEKIYIDECLEFGDNDLKTTWSKNLIKKELILPLENILKQNLYEDFEQ